ncbi:Na+/H+ antiporter [Flavitalea sp.]|nr:Na+/H+ antiporter [Flavitalea sp.]
MPEQFIEYLYLILIILLLVTIANKLRIAYPIILVLGGLILSFTGLFARISIVPDLIFFIFLPPLLYEAAWQTSWKEFWKWRRVIMSFAFPIVIITACVMAFVSRSIIPGFTLALGFLLGGIISPPDAISATTIMRNLKVPKSLVSIIEGESLLNDASSLIVFRFAVIAVMTGQFDFQNATTNFFMVVIMGILIGVCIGLIFYVIHRNLPTTSGVEIILTLVTPYCMYYAAEHFHFSGVLAVVSGGLLLSSKRHSMLSYRSRIEGINVWTNFVFLLNGLIFLLIGFQLPLITGGLGNIRISTAIWYGLGISVILIITRLACTLGASIFTRFISHFITVADSNPGWKLPLISGWAGMRGVVSLAAALSIPLVTSDGTPFPFRNLILFVTFIVILMTLVLQGLTLPWLIRRLKLEDKYATRTKQEQELFIQQKITNVSTQFLQDNYSQQLEGDDQLNNLYEKFQIEMQSLKQNSNTRFEPTLNTFDSICLALLEQQRDVLRDINRLPDFDEDLIRTHLAIIDLEEFKIREKMGLKEKPTLTNTG